MALTDKIKSIADAIRTKTGKTEKMTMDQMAEEILGIETSGFIYSGKNVEKVAEFNDVFHLSDTTFVIGTDVSTSAKTIKTTEANKYVTQTLAIGDKDIIVVQTGETVPEFESSAVAKARPIKSVYRAVSWCSKRKTTDTSAKTTRQLTNSMTAYMIQYYNASGVITRAQTNSYGFYPTVQTVSIASSTSANTTVRVSSPTISYRCSSTYFSVDNAKLIKDITLKWKIEVYLCDPGTTIGANFNDVFDDLLINGME